MSDLLPPNATPQERAISRSVDRAVPVPVRTLWNPATCPEGILPWLAWSLSVDEWDASWPVDQKRAAIAASIETHRRKGTIGALRRALQALGYEVEIDEKTGDAYTFRLLFKVGAGSAGGALIDAAITEATAIALRQKNARSALAGTQYLATNGATGGPIIASTQLSGSETDVEEFAGPSAPAELELTGTVSPNLNGTYYDATDGSPRGAWTDGAHRIGKVDTGGSGPYPPGQSSVVWCIYTPGVGLFDPPTIHWRQNNDISDVDLFDVVWVSSGGSTGAPILTPT